jgi:hypothetical protein
MKATLKPVTSYQVSLDTVNGSVPIPGMFVRKSTWNGLVELRDTKTGSVIVAVDADFASSCLLRMFNPEEARESTIIMATPDIGALVKENLTPKAVSDNNSGA